MPFAPPGFAFGAPFWDSVRDAGYEENASLVNPWDVLFLDERRVPGIVESIAVVPKMLIHCAKGSGKDGGATIERGHEAARIEISQKIWMPTQWIEWQALKALVWRGPGQKPRTRDGGKQQAATGAVAIRHPACQDAKIFLVVFESISSAEPAKEVGARIVKMKAIQYIAGSKKDPAPKEYKPLANVSSEGKPIQAGVPAKTESEKPVPARDRP